MMNNDLISRSALLEAINFDRRAAKEHPQEIRERFERLCDYAEILVEQTPTVDAEPVRHGRWIPYKQNVECSECHVKWAVDESIAVVYTSIKDLKYCPNCGAKMGAEVEG